MCRPLLMTIGCLLILFGISGLWMMPKLIQQKLEQRMQLRIDTKTFDRFTKVPIPLTVKFYLFNITNSERVLLGLERPQFQEVGPFMFKQWRRREVVDFEDYNRRLKYREIKTFYPMLKKATLTNSNNSKLPSNNSTLIISRHNSDNITTTTYNNSSNNKHNDDIININNNYHSSNDNNTSHNIAQHQQPNQSPQSDPFMLDPYATNITIINLPLLSVLTKLAQLEDGSLKRNIAARVAGRLIQDGRDKILITKPANELLFDGYKVDFMESARDLVSGTLGFNFESPLPKNTFGFFYMKNNTWTRRDNGILAVFTGRNESMNDYMMIESFNDQRELNVWPKNTLAGNRCNQIRGTDGSQFHPGVTKTQVLSIFSPMVCRSLYIKYKEDTSARDIPLLRFSMPAELFAAPKKSIQNACFCTVASNLSQATTSSGTTPSQAPTTIPPNGASAGAQQVKTSFSSSSRITDSRCYLDGLMDLSLCQRGAPIAASSPHFYNADPMLAMAAGLRPRKELHETYIDIEPMTGSVFRAASRAQLNAYVEQAALDVVDNSIIGNMTAMIAPLLWLEESAEIDEPSSIEFKDKLLNLVQKAKRSFIYSILIGILIILIVSLQYWYVTCYSSSKGTSSGRKHANKTKNNRHQLQKTASEKRKRFQAGANHNNNNHLHSNLRLGGGAQKSNQLASLGPKIRNPELDEDDDETQESIAIPVIAMAAALGAGGGVRGSDRNKGKHIVKKSRQANVGNSAAVGVNYEDEEELSKRMLVADEWEPAAATTNTSGGSLSGRSSQAALDNNATRVNNEDVDDDDEEEEATGFSKEEEEEQRDLMRPSTSSM